MVFENNSEMIQKDTAVQIRAGEELDQNNLEKYFSEGKDLEKQILKNLKVLNYE